MGRDMELEMSRSLCVHDSAVSSTIRAWNCGGKEGNGVMGRGVERAGYRYIAELVGGHPLSIGSGVALLQGRSDVDRLRTQDLGQDGSRMSLGSSRSPPWWGGDMDVPAG